MKFIMRVLAVLFVFAIPMSANARDGAWKYRTEVDPLTDETWSSAVKTPLSGLDLLKEAEVHVVLIVLEVSCRAAVLSAKAGFGSKHEHYKAGGVFSIKVRFDKNPAFDMAWVSRDSVLSPGSKMLGLSDIWLNDFDVVMNRKNHGATFLKGLRTSERLLLRVEQSSDVHTVPLSGVSTEPLDRVLRDCGRDDLLK